ncbi:guided entry of tail-anchored proteins factor 1 isoform X2 [Meriones unguiculatus]|uniref:guided entry of tail-anchored proteins factor 1 isoform X2 n=1 Tax=Meriones unguiculatus TaxID=10047 RepID=UPI000B4FA34F|nr:guided entry of tail-anchored proteins factor 1 isoform X2 [Meriones unguiculatus]XP_021519917.1 tail-anchored protein insertion receptor WRB isoform X2 [Meriones unguiculatus]
MSASEADRWAWLLVLSFVFGCNVLRILLPALSSFVSRVLQKDAEQEAQMRAEIQDMKQELATINMMDEFARYARLERKINKTTDRLKTHGADGAAGQGQMVHQRRLLRTAGSADGVPHLEVLLGACGRGAQQVDHPAGSPGRLSNSSGRWHWNHLLDFGV